MWQKQFCKQLSRVVRLGLARCCLITGICITGICFPAFSETTEKQCLSQLPAWLTLAADAPSSSRFTSPREDVFDFTTQKGGAGLGYARRYRNVYCDVLIYVYDRQKEALTADDVQSEIDSFDGFPIGAQFRKEVGDEIFQGLAGQFSVTKKQTGTVEMVSIGRVNNRFVKYRTSCLAVNNVSEDAHFRMADLFTTRVLKETYQPLKNCLNGVESPF